ncbi:4-vinyl reductase [Xanthobacter autotrophicus]|uniref:4-vinyl reductase n=1 Tax=Xanthobacter TaxID=279 RepID=UPI0024AC39BE|nr:4-vinyl reductase [Xanthobacter autotrophicus]MDI4666483.1 4-vinyl reductase [Xanthobacter autotrophicus]
MAKPEIEIDVDPATGRWFVDKMPMILVPQHFYNNNHFAIEGALGAEAFDAALAPAGHLSAFVWCRKQAEVYGLEGVDVFAHYMKRLSQRGWGLFSIRAIDPVAGTATIRLDNSSFVTDETRNAGRKLCYMFAPWLAGALEFVCEQAGAPQKLEAREVQCAAEGHDFCLYEVRPAA